MIGYPKPVSKAKTKAKPIKRVSSKAVHVCSDGSRVSQSQINANLSYSYTLGPLNSRCQSYPHIQADNHSHIVSQKRLKELGLTELIWSHEMFTYDSMKSHNEWEGCSHSIEDHANLIYKMSVMFLFDKPGYWRRFERLSNYKVMTELRKITGV